MELQRNQKFEGIQSELDQRDARLGGITLNPTLPGSVEEIKNNVAMLLQNYIAGNYTVVNGFCNDSL